MKGSLKDKMAQIGGDVNKIEVLHGLKSLVLTFCIFLSLQDKFGPYKPES